MCIDEIDLLSVDVVIATDNHETDFLHLPTVFPRRYKEWLRSVRYNEGTIGNSF